MVSSQMLWQFMQASMQSCIRWVRAGIIPDWVMAPPGRRWDPGRAPCASVLRRGAVSRTSGRACPARPGEAPARDGALAREGGRTRERRPAGRLPSSPVPYGRLRAMTMRWTWLVPS
ncbi:hypothetical protein EASAB2608_02661 [Streptomyces sp. EAS-AB2608]|nr:hypothetical protein EASAB2608_02661 [Streptomyces sp. EAS-AB2608]